MSPRSVVTPSVSYKQTTLSKYGVFLLGCVVTLLFSGGLILGFGPLYSTLVAEGAWHETCPIETWNDTSLEGVCPSQEAALSQLFTIAYLGLALSLALFGILLDRLGPRLLTVAGCGVAVVGNAAVALAKTSNPWGPLLLTVGLTLLGSGGMAIFLSCFPLVKNFKNQGIMCTILGSLFGTSSFVYTVLQLFSLSIASFFTFYALLAAVAAVVCWVVYPSKSTVFALPIANSTSSNLAENGLLNPTHVVQMDTSLDHFDGHEQVLRLSNTSSSSSLMITKRTDSMPRNDKDETLCFYHPELPLGPQLSRLLKTHPALRLFIIYYSWMYVVTCYARKSFPALLSAANSPHNDLGLYVNFLFPFICNSSFVVAPLVGYLIDTKGFPLVLGLNMVICLLFCLSCLLVTSRVLYIGVFLLFLGSSGSLFMIQQAYILMEFPAHLFGSIQCVLQLVAFCAGLTTFIMGSLSHTTGFLILMGPLLLMFSAGLYGMVKKKHSPRLKQTSSPTLMMVDSVCLEGSGTTQLTTTTDAAAAGHVLIMTPPPCDTTTRP